MYQIVQKQMFFQYAPKKELCNVHIINLNLFVKVKAGWADDERALKSLGYADFEDK